MAVSPHSGQEASSQACLQRRSISASSGSGRNTIQVGSTRSCSIPPKAVRLHIATSTRRDAVILRVLFHSVRQEPLILLKNTSSSIKTCCDPVSTAVPERWHAFLGTRSESLILPNRLCCNIQKVMDSNPARSIQRTHLPARATILPTSVKNTVRDTERVVSRWTLIIERSLGSSDKIALYDNPNITKYKSRFDGNA